MSVIFINPYVFAGAYDTDAQTYITAVEAADQQALETGVKDAINAFVVGCKADGIWSAIKASCILAGARTLNGALVPLVGAAPTNFNFVSGDYNRKTGLIGSAADGTSTNAKRLDTNAGANSTSTPANNCHLSVYVSTTPTSGGNANTRAFIGVGGNNTGATHLAQTFTGAESGIVVRNQNSISCVTPNSVSTQTGFIGSTRSNSSSISARQNKNNSAFDRTSETRQAKNYWVYGVNWDGGSGTFVQKNLIGNARLAFYSIGESLDLALLDARVTALINAFAAAIP